MAILVAMATTTSSLHAQLSESQRAQLVSDMRASADQLDATRIPELEVSKQDFLFRVAELHQFLQTATTPENYDAWLEYFEFDPLIKAIDAGESPATIWREAQSLQHRLIGIAPGLEVSQVRAVRDAVNQLIPAVRYRDREKSVALIGRQLNALATRFEQLASVPSIDDAAASNLILGILDDANQDVPAVETLRRLYSHPNAAVWIGESLVQQVVGRPVDERNKPVNDNILGTRIVGKANLNGVVQANLLPATNAVRMQITLTGHVSSDNIGYNGPVRLRTKGYAGICVTRTVNASESGFVFEPTYTDANLQTEINAIEHPLRLVRRIAWRKARQTKPLADKIAKARMQQRLGDEFDQATRETASAAPPDPLARVRPMLQRLELPEPARALNSTDDAIVVHSIFRRTDQVGSPVSPPPFPTRYDAVIQLHESALDNAFGHLLAGRTMNEGQMNQLLADAGRPLPAAEEKQDEPPFEIDFAKVRPIVFEARDHALRVGIRGTRFATGRRELKRPLEITAQYTAATTEDGVAILTREGDVQVDFPGNRRLTISQAGLRRTIEEKFADVFPTILLDRPLEVPADVPLPAMRGRVFRPRLVTANDGWLTIAIR